MAQDLDLIIELLRETEKANKANSQNFEHLLAGIDEKLTVMGKNSATSDFIKAYLAELTQSFDERFSTTLTKVKDIEYALKTIYSSIDEHVKTEDIRELFDIFSKNLSNVYSEARQQKAVLSGIEAKLSEIATDKTDKDDIIRTITVLRNDFENLNSSYRHTVDTVNSDIKKILSNLINSEQTAALGMEQLESLSKSINDIVSYLKNFDKRDIELTQLLSNVATNESLKITQGAVDTIVKKSEEISQRVTLLADKADMERLQSSAGIMVQKLDNSVSREMFMQITDKTDEIISQTDEVRQTLADVTKNIETLPDTKALEYSLNGLFNKLQSLGTDLSNASNVKENIHDLENKVSNIVVDLTTIKNIVSDISEVVYTKVIQSINEITFENESYDIKSEVAKMLSMLPQKEDIERLLTDNNLNRDAIDELVRKADIIADRLDNLPTHSDMETLNNTQLSLVENLQEVADKDDVEALSEKADEIEEMIDQLNFDDEFSSLYDKTSSIEAWLENSNLKENSEDLLLQMPNKAEQKDLIQILKATEKIVSGLEELSNNVDVKKVNRTVADVYAMIEELKNDFMNTTEMHHDSVIVQLSELQKSITRIATVEDFNNFVDGLKSFVETAVENNTDIAANLAEIKTYEETIIEKLNNLDTSALENIISKQAAATGSKLTSLSEYMTSLLNSNKTDIQSSLSEILEILRNKKSNYSEIAFSNESAIENIEKYLKEVKSLLSNNGKPMPVDLADKISTLEELSLETKAINENFFADILAKIQDYKTYSDSGEAFSQQDLTNSMSEIVEIKSQLQTLGDTFNSLHSDTGSIQADITAFVANKFDELASNMDQLNTTVESKLDSGFAYNAELIEEKTNALIEFVKELRAGNIGSSELAEPLATADGTLADVKNGLELLRTDVVSSLNTKTERLIYELSPIKQMLSTFVEAIKNGSSDSLIESLESLHGAVINSVDDGEIEFDRLDDLYNRISDNLLASENNIRDFILSDIDAVLLKLESIRGDLEDSLSRVVPPDAQSMKEFNEFVAQINDFKNQQKAMITEVAEDIKSSITDTVTAQYEEIKSILAVSINNDRLVEAIESLKHTFKVKLRELKSAQITDSDAPVDEFDTNEFEQAFEGVENAPYAIDPDVVTDIKNDFDKFSELVAVLSDKNPEITEVLESIKSKMDSLSIIKTERDDLLSDESLDDFSDSDFDDDYDPDSDDEILVGVNNFDIIKALELLKADIQNLHNNVEKLVPQQQQIQTSEALEKGASPQSAQSVNELAQLLKNDWLEEIKNYIAGSEIHSMLENISEKIDILTHSEKSGWVEEIKQSLATISSNDFSAVTDSNKQIQDMLNLINEKVDIIASTEDYNLIEDVRSALDKLDQAESDEKSEKLLNLINDKIDIIAEADNYDDISQIKDSLDFIEERVEDLSKASADIDDIKYTVMSMEDKFLGVDRLSEADAEITGILKVLNNKIDDSLGSKQDIEDIKHLIMSQMSYIEKLEKNNKTEAVRKCLEELTVEVNSLNSVNNSTKHIQKTLADMKESILAAVITVFDQISFIEEAEDIKDFVEEKTDEINQSLSTVTNQLKQITNAEDAPDYSYSMQDIESDLAKLRLALNNAQASEQEVQAERLSFILDNINQMGSAINDLQSSLSGEEALAMKHNIDKINEDLINLSTATNHLIINSGESYNAISSGIENFSNVLTYQLGAKVDKVTGLLEKSNASDKVMRQALIYMGEWIDAASESMNKISTNSDEIVDVKSTIETLKASIPEQTDILNSIEEKFDEQQDRLKFLEKQINKLNVIEEQFEQQHQRIDRLELSLEKILSAIEELDDSKVPRKIDKIEKQLVKLSTNIEKLASYVD